jgi:hypothetical protein
MAILWIGFELPLAQWDRSGNPAGKRIGAFRGIGADSPVRAALSARRGCAHYILEKNYLLR